jgi:hypothetical protein
MRYGTETEAPFDTDNHAWRRFTAVAGDHFEVVTWTRPDDRPVMVSLVDLHTGDTCTLAVLDSVEVRDPHALLIVTATGEVTVHGPAAGPTAAEGHAERLALTDAMVAASRAVPLHHPAAALPDTGWVDLPSVSVTPAPADGDVRAVAVLLIHKDRLAVVGPFGDQAASERWQPADGGTVERHVIALHPIPPTPPEDS